MTQRTLSEINILKVKVLFFNRLGLLPFLKSSFPAVIQIRKKNYPIMILLLIIILFISFRNLTWIIIPIIVILCTVITTMGILRLMGWALNVLNVILPLLLTIDFHVSITPYSSWFIFPSISYNIKKKNLSLVLSVMDKFASVKYPWIKNRTLEFRGMSNS